MKKKDQEIADAIIDYKLKLIKYSNKTVREVLQILAKLEQDILNKMPHELDVLKKRRLNAILKDIGETSERYYSKIAESVAKDLAPIPGIADRAYMAAVSDTIGAEFTALLSPSRLETLAKAAIIQGAPTNAWWRKQDTDLRFKVQNVLRKGYAQGINPRDIAIDIKKTMNISQRNAETLVRTSFMTVSNDALRSTYKNNLDVIDKLEWLSTLDSRTCKYCMSMDGRKWKPDNAPSLPAHHNCRCVLTPITKTWRQMGIAVDEMDHNRRSMDVIVSSDMTFDKFLERKGKKYQVKMLGAGRADLWRDGKITISDLVNNRGRELTLAELKAL